MGDIKKITNPKIGELYKFRIHPSCNPIVGLILGIEMSKSKIIKAYKNNLFEKYEIYKVYCLESKEISSFYEGEIIQHIK